jgi:hypothetical protein
VCDEELLCCHIHTYIVYMIGLFKHGHTRILLNQLLCMRVCVCAYARRVVGACERRGDNSVRGGGDRPT